MALIHLDHVPDTVKVNLPLNIIIPDPGSMKGVPVRQRKVLYLLHGLSDDASAWQRYSSIETVAKSYGLVVVMPSVERSFYTNLPNGQAFFSYIVDEIPQYLSDVFDLSPIREDTLIAGLSMGGYGTLKAALLRPEKYCAAASFSGVTTLDILKANPHDERRAEFTAIFGDLDQLSGSEYDPAVWLKRAVQNKTELPRLFVSCGRQDDLYPANLGFKALCEELGVDLNYYEADGKHDWYFWDAEIRRFLKAVLGEPVL